MLRALRNAAVATALAVACALSIATPAHAAGVGYATGLSTDTLAGHVEVVLQGYVDFPDNLGENYTIVGVLTTEHAKCPSAFTVVGYYRVGPLGLWRKLVQSPCWELQQEPVVGIAQTVRGDLDTSVDVKVCVSQLPIIIVNQLRCTNPTVLTPPDGS